MKGLHPASTCGPFCTCILSFVTCQADLGVRYGDAMSPSNFRCAMSIAVPSPAIFSARKTVPTERDGGDAKNPRSGLARVDLQVHCEVGIVPQYSFGIASAEQPDLAQRGIRTSSRRGRKPRAPLST